MLEVELGGVHVDTLPAIALLLPDTCLLILCRRLATGPAGHMMYRGYAVLTCLLELSHHFGLYNNDCKFNGAQNVE